MRSWRWMLGLLVLTLSACATQITAEDKGALAVGNEAPNFTLQTLDGDKVELAALRKQGPVVVIVLRGYPGYQCPVCNVQVGQFLGSAKKFADAKANIVLVYPGPGKELDKHASEFIRGKTLPKNVYFVTDPDYAFTNAYKLRWDAENETAYPSTFVIKPDGKIAFAKISRTHGDRSKVEDVLKALK